jgi:hypothetical protein
MRCGDAKPRRAARLMAYAGQDPLERDGLSPRAFRAKRSTPPRAKAQLSLGVPDRAPQAFTT